MTSHNRFDDLSAPQQAGILCNDPRFQRFAAIRSGLPGESSSAPAPPQNTCAPVAASPSRRALASSATASSFAALRTEFDAWTGKIATPTIERITP
ncbi:MAG: hypothetical protein R3D81_03435 [Thalassovita sp.]